MTSRNLVRNTLEFCNIQGRVPRQLWSLPWAEMHHPGKTKRIAEEYPDDIVVAPSCQKIESKMQKGNAFLPGRYVDDWGCVFENIQKGVVGEVKKPIMPAEDEEWEDVSPIHIPYEWLTVDKEQVNAFCAGTDQFVLSGICPRPFEQLQFIRGTEQLYIDLLNRPKGLFDFLRQMHSFYCEAVELWCTLDIDAIQFMDDWGAQRALLVNPQLWEELFLPMYRDYVKIAHRYGKKAFMHSDGHILSIFPQLIEMGLDAVNSQIFCMGIENLTQFRGKITFWGEIDRQNLLPYGSLQDIEDAVQTVYQQLWDNGGCIAQCEFGPGAKPANVQHVFEVWNALR